MKQSFDPQSIMKLGYIKTSEYAWELTSNTERADKHKAYKETFARLNKLKDKDLQALYKACTTVTSYDRWEFKEAAERDKVLKIIGDHVKLCVDKSRHYSVDKFDRECLEAVVYARQLPVSPQESSSCPTVHIKCPGRKSIKSGVTDLSNLEREIGLIQKAFDSLRPEMEKSNPSLVGKTRAKVAERLDHRHEQEVNGEIVAELRCLDPIEWEYQVTHTTIEYTVCGYPAKIKAWSEILYGMSDGILKLCKQTQPKSKPSTVNIFENL